VKSFFSLFKKLWGLIPTAKNAERINPILGVTISLGTGYVNPMGNNPKWIIIHHSATPDSITRNWNAIREYHIRVNGWKDIGYHRGIENVNGKLTVHKGRDIGQIGAHAVGFNAKSIGICLVGNYDLYPVSEDRLSLLALVCRELQKQYSIPRAQVIGHRETYPIRGVPVEKSCPGELFNMDEFRKRLVDVEA